MLVERRQAAWSGLKAALQDSFCQMDPTVSSYICDVLANAGDGEERDAGSLIPSLPAILSAHAVRARVRARDTEFGPTTFKDGIRGIRHTKDQSIPLL